MQVQIGGARASQRDCHRSGSAGLLKTNMDRNRVFGRYGRNNGARRTHNRYDIVAGMPHIMEKKKKKKLYRNPCMDV